MLMPQDWINVHTHRPVDVGRVALLGCRVAHCAVELADVVHAIAAEVRLADCPVLIVCRHGKRLLIR